MLSFAQHSKIEDVKKASLGMSRDNMPQVMSKSRDDFKDWMFDNGITHYNNEMHPEHFKFCQNEFDTDKIEKMMSNPQPPSEGGLQDSGILMSQDNYILDGNHRALAALLSNNQPMLKCTKIEMPIKELLTKMKSFDDVKYKEV